MGDSDDNDDEVARMIKYRNLANKNDKLKMDMKGLVGECKNLKKTIEVGHHKNGRHSGVWKSGRVEQGGDKPESGQKGYVTDALLPVVQCKQINVHNLLSVLEQP